MQKTLIILAVIVFSISALADSQKPLDKVATSKSCKKALQAVETSAWIPSQMVGAEHITINSELAEIAYMHIPDEFTKPDDIVVEATQNGSNYEITYNDLLNSSFMGEKTYMLPNGDIISFYIVAVIH